MSEMHYLAGYLPADYMESPQVVEIQDAIEVELDTVKTVVNSLQNQMFVETAAAEWGIPLWEELYGIYPDITLADSERRERVKAVMRGQGTATPAFIKALAETFVEGEVEVAEDNPNYHFDINIIGVVGEPPRMNAMIAAIEKAKPAHLSFSVNIRYNTWNDVAEANYTWNMASVKTWDALKGEAL